MNAELILTGAYIRHIDVRRTEKGPQFVIVHVTSNYNAQACEQMGWQPYMEGLTSAKLEGMVATSHLVMTPNAKELAHHEIQADLNDATDFGYFSVKDGESEKSELRFQIRSSSEGAEAVFGGYWRHIGFAPATLKIAYAKQETLPGMEKKAEAAKA